MCDRFGVIRARIGFMGRFQAYISAGGASVRRNTPTGCPIVRWMGMALIAMICAPAAFAQNPRILDRAEYADRLRAMWLAEAIANWTGLRTEGARIDAPFLTDADWGTTPPGFGQPIDFVTTQDPWWADDDTDIEYVYAEELVASSLTTLTPAQIRQAWIDHINRYIWVSNAVARNLMNRGVTPPSTGLFVANTASLHIDAQLTTEIFGALAPGMPERALEMADLPIRTTASGHAAHAAQFFVALYALAPLVDTSMSGRDQALWLINRARAHIPGSSKTADVIDFVLSDYLANPDVNDWERTRDLVHQRYQANAGANGFLYRAWFESSVNLATGVIALLYGEMDLKRTIQIGTLSGWDSDNGTATMGGLIGLVQGIEAIRAQFPDVTLSDRFWILRTRDNLTDYLPADPSAEDTFQMLAQRMLGVVDRVFLDSGGLVDTVTQRYALPTVAPGDPLDRSPTHRLQQRSANNRVRADGGTVIASCSVAVNPPCCAATPLVSFIADGFEHDFRGHDALFFGIPYFSTQGAGLAPGALITLSVTYDRPVEIEAVRLVEGDALATGGWFNSVSVEVLVGASWVPAPASPSEPLDPLVPYQSIDFALLIPTQATGIRLTGPAGGPGAFVTVAELDALAPDPCPPPGPTTDLTGDGQTGIEDLYAWHLTPVDFDASGDAGDPDRRYLQTIVRWPEPTDTPPTP